MFGPSFQDAVRRGLGHLDVGNHHLVSGWRAELASRLSASTGEQRGRGRRLPGEGRTSAPPGAKGLHETAGFSQRGPGSLSSAVSSAIMARPNHPLFCRRPDRAFGAPAVVSGAISSCLVVAQLG